MRTRRTLAGAGLLLWTLCVGCDEGERAAAQRSDGPLPVASSQSRPREACEGPHPAVPPTPPRLLTRWEYARTVRDLLGIDLEPHLDLPAESSRTGFDTDAAAHQATPLLVERSFFAAEALAEAAVEQRLSALLPCDPAQGEAECAAAFIRSFGRRAFRRPLEEAEAGRLLDLFIVERGRGGFAAGMRAVIQAVLQSPQLLDRLEDAPSSTRGEEPTPVGPFEMASRLSYLL